MAGARPIVTTNAGGVSEVVLDGETGIVVPIKDPTALAAGIVRLHGDRDLARQMVEKGRERVLRHFTAEVLTEKTIAVYQRVLAGEVGPDFPIPPEP
jgi:glycosyltransferase involved in cell wall biosynthesis